MIRSNEKVSRTPTGYRVAPMNYVKLESIADELGALLPKVPNTNGMRVDARRTLEVTLRQAGYEYHVVDVDTLDDTAAFTIPDERLIVFREDVYNGIDSNNVFSRSTVIHELSHIVLKHATTLKRGAIGEHGFFEDSEWQAKALTAAVMMPINACKAVNSAIDLAHLCGTSVEAATYRLSRLIDKNIIPPKCGTLGLFDIGGAMGS